jgi:Protein of unknown function with PCYCGC motif
MVRLRLIALGVTLIAAGALMAACSSDGETTQATLKAPMSSVPQAPPQPLSFQVAADLPPVPGNIYTAARPAEVVKAAYLFAAQHPEVLQYMPCFCGCERGGHRGNDDCFVSARDAAGKPSQWEQHGMVCEVCLDVATQARQMHNSGASLTTIRDAIEKKYAGAPGHTPTPLPKKGTHD